MLTCVSLSASVSACNEAATLFSPILFKSIGDKELGSRDAAEHSITLWTNMGELDPKDTINEKQQLGAEVRRLI